MTKEPISLQDALLRLVDFTNELTDKDLSNKMDKVLKDLDCIYQEAVTKGIIEKFITRYKTTIDKGFYYCPYVPIVNREST